MLIYADIVSGEVIDRAELEIRMVSAQLQGEPHLYIMELGPGVIMTWPCLMPITP